MPYRYKLFESMEPPKNFGFLPMKKSKNAGSTKPVYGSKEEVEAMRTLLESLPKSEFDRY